MKRKETDVPTPEQAKRHASARASIQSEFPPKRRSTSKPAKESPAMESIAEQLRKAREAQGLTWYAVAKAAGVPNSGTIRSIEAGRDAKLSNVEAIAKVLGLRLELESTR